MTNDFTKKKAQELKKAKKSKTRFIPRPNRERLKRQITVRVDEELLRLVVERAETTGMRLTDAVEHGLWTYLRENPSTTVLRGRFLWNQIPLRLQRLTMSFWVYISNPRPTVAEDIFRRAVDDVLWDFRAHPDYEPGLERLGQQDTGKSLP